MRIPIPSVRVLLVLALGAPARAGADAQVNGVTGTPAAVGVPARAGVDGERSPTGGQPEFYERGRSLIDAGDVEQALMLWATARDSLSKMDAEDPRIGRAFVEAVADTGLEGYGEIATEMFYWGLSPNTAAAEPYRTEVLEEGRRTFVLVDSLLAEYWAERGREDPVALAREIERFWLERDPTPTTPVNERLLEHWKRVTDARLLFRYNRSSPFGTDDRGTFLVKYGTPDRIKKGVLSVNRWEQSMIRVPQEVIDRYDKMPQYEIWRYATLHADRFTYFVFGNIEGSGPFQHVEGIHKLIPAGARSYTVDFRGDGAPLGASTRGRRAVHYLEYAYYRDVVDMGGPFGLRADELDRMWLQRYTPREGTMQATSLRFIGEDRRALRQPRPPALSDYDDSGKSALSAQAARILDGDQPRILVLAVSSPLWMPRLDSEATPDSIVLNPYAARHTVIARDHDLNELARAGMLPLGEESTTSSVLLRHERSVGHLTVSVEHLVEGANEEESEERRDTGIDGIGILPGHIHFRPGPPLSRSAADSEISDLVVGIVPQPGLDIGDMPVPLLPAHRLWRNDLLRVYFEIYHPHSAAEGESRSFDVRLRIVPVGILPEPVEDRAAGTAAVEVRLESQAPSTPHFFDLDLRNERSGAMHIILRITDRQTGTSRIRFASLHLLEH